MTLTPPLLAVMSGAKVRPRRARMPVPKESKLHADVADLLRDHCLPGWRWTHVNRKCANAREGAIMKRMGVNRGWPDFLLFSPFDNRQVHGLELKRPGEDLTEDQEDWQDWAALHGVKYEVAWTMDQVLRIFDAWACLRVRVPVRRCPDE